MTAYALPTGSNRKPTAQPTQFSEEAATAAFMSWRAMRQSNRVAGFSHKYEVYQDIERFLKPWNTRGKPDLGELWVLTSAWDRSHFLFRKEVTDYIRQMWLDAIKAHEAEQVIDGEIAGDRDEALKLKNHYFQKYPCDEEYRRRVFMPDMRH